MPAPATMTKPGIESTLRALGGRSRYQLLQLLVINLGVWGAAFQLLDNIFTGRKVTWQQCAPPGNGTSLPARLQHVDWSSAEHVTYGPCEIIVAIDHRNETFPCLFGYLYDYPRELSFRTEFDLVCGRSLMADFLQTLVIMGQGCGALLASLISDRYGRKGVLVWSQAGMLVVGISIGLAPSYALLACLKFVVGCLQQGVMTGKATMSIELFPSEFRSMTSLMMALMWMTGTCVMALTSFLLQNYSWRLLQCVLSSVSLLALLQCWYLDESMRWLLANGKKEAAIGVLHRAARINHQDVTLVMTTLCGGIISHDVSGDLDVSNVSARHPCDGSSDHSDDNFKIQRLRRRTKVLDDHDLQHHHNDNDDSDSNGWEMVSPGQHTQGPEEEPLLTSDKDSKGDQVHRSGPRVHGSMVRGQGQDSELSGQGHSSDMRGPGPGVRGQGSGQKVPGSEDTARELVSNQKPSQKMTLLPVLRRHRTLRTHTALIWAAWFTCTFSAFSLYVMSTSLHGNRFLNLFLTAAMKLPAGLLFFYMVDRVGRKAGIQTFFVLAAVGQLTGALLRAFEDNDLLAVLSVPASMIGSMGATGIFGALFLYTPELYPTNIRQQALGYASLAGRLGGMVSPFMIPLSEVLIWAPGVLSGSMCFAVIFLFSFLPETRGRELPQTLEDIDRWEVAKEEGRETEKSWNFLSAADARSALRVAQKLCHSLYTQCVRLSQGLLTRRNKGGLVFSV